MSAFVVDRRHIDLIVSVIKELPADAEADESEVDLLRSSISRKLSEREPEISSRMGILGAVGEILIRQNVASVLYRYDNDESMVPDYTRSLYEYQPLPFRPTCAEVLKALDCYDYQACETPDWEQTTAHWITSTLRDYLIKILPGYDRAPWEWNDDEVARRMSGD